MAAATSAAAATVKAADGTGPLFSRRAVLQLADGTEWKGFSFGAHRSTSGECVFQTGMVGYVESLTDPSYTGQLLVLAYPLIGNYGVPPTSVDRWGFPQSFESSRVHVSALIVGEVSEQFSHYTATRSLPDWLQEQGVPGIHGIDTRALIKHLRDRGSLLAKIIVEPDSPSSVEQVDPNKENLVAKVSTKQVLQYGEGDKQILVVDCGMKYNQIRCFLKRGVRVKIVPYDFDFTAEQYDGLFLTNGPGDPTMCAKTIANLRTVLAVRPAKPIFGICLGHQLLALAAGATTYKLRYGNRGHNQPCVNQLNERCYLTSQNHGYAVDTKTLPADWELFYENANDKTNEGIRHRTLPFFSVQFHPEACAGPEETEYLFDVFLHSVRGLPPYESGLTRRLTPERTVVRKVVLLGSGGLSIGQAGEFDYSGSQAIKALKEEGIETVLINPNIATVQTSTDLADTVYFLPVTPDFVTDVLEKERPDGILISFGGQTALNCGMELDKRGTFARLGVRVLGTPLTAIQDTEDRGLFVQRLAEINEKAARSSTATTVDEALRQAEEIGFPVIIRAAFALGGLGSGFAHNKEELKELASKALSLSEQVLVERSMKGWKEIEYEVVRDAFDNCVTVCNMENFDPLGIHTGESIVVAPSQTLTNADYQMLRNTSIKVIRHLGIVGECNIQYALNPDSNEYCIIEVNARLSRSSALASKATGYPLAFVAAKLALGYSLPSLRNSVTKSTTACFEPALDYIVVKMPLWDLKKFDKAQRQIGTAMKSVGEVMSIGRTFEEALQKAVRMANPSVQSVIDGFGAVTEDEGDLDAQLANPNDRRIIHLGVAMQKGYDVERLHQLTRIDRWFLHKLHGIVRLEKALTAFNTTTLPRPLLLRAKQLGFSDRQIARCVGSTELVVRKLRQDHGVAPVVKQIDTVSAEFPAHNNYLYLTYCGVEHDVAFAAASGVVVLGSGGYRIGTSVEFDWSAVGCVKTLQSLGGRAIMVNCNPETVSTDYDVCDRLYFDELTLERVLDIADLERPQGVILAVGGQIANNLAMPLYRQGVPVLGTNPEMVDAAENRYKFSRLLDTLGVMQPAWRQLSSLADARNFCASVQYPCLVRPSYVLSGASMKVVYTDEDLESFLVAESTVVSQEYPVVISKFISGAKEIEIDAVAVKGRILAQVVSEHVENAGVHSGDATIVCPPFDLRPETVTKIVEATRRIAGALDISGPFNIQYIAKENEIKVIECNVRASRSLPFVSKTMKVDLIALATKAILGRAAELSELTLEPPAYFGVKVPMFSFTRLRGADPVLGVDMASTGEVACFGRTPHEAYLKAQLATGFRLPKKSVLLSIGSFAEKAEFVASARRLVELGYALYGTPGTGDFFSEQGVKITTVMWDDEKAGAPAVLKGGQTDLYINLPSKNKYRRPAAVMSHGYQTRRLAADLSIPLITNIKTAKFFVESLVHVPNLHRLSAYDCQMSRRIVTIPGLIDLHVHLREPGGEHKEDWDTGTAAALAGGFTVVAAMPNTRPAITNEESFALVSRLAAAKARCDYAIYVGASADNAQTAPLLADRAAGLKMYLNDTFSNLKLLDLNTWGEHLKRWPAHVPIAVHAEGKTLAALLLMAVMHDRAVHVCHVSTKEELSLIQAAKAKGWRVTCEVCPHHLFLTHEGACCSLGHTGKAEVRPSLASEEDRAYLWANLAAVDTFGTDHAPHTLEEKTSDKPPPGFPGLEAALPLLLTAVHEGKLTLDDLIAKTHTNPRRIFNLPEQPDTYVEVDLDRQWTLPDKPRYSKCGWSPYGGRKVRGCVRRVVVRGVTAFVDGTVLAPPGTGLDLRALAPPRGAEAAVVKRRGSIVPSSPVTPHLSAPLGASASGLASTPLPPLSSEISAEALHLDRGVIASLVGRHVLAVSQFNHGLLHVIFNLAHEMRLLVQRQGTTDLLKNRVMATAFYEPSTRTCTSFTAAMERLGGRVVSVTPETSSVAKGESLPDTIRTLESYVDLIVLRHPEAGAAQLAARFARKPIINGGDGTGEHPTQALLDVFTIREERGTVHGLTVTLVGDLKHGRTVHSLVRLLAAYRPRLQYVSPPALRMPREIVAELDALGIPQTEHERLDGVLPGSDVLYVTRIQKERFASPVDFEAVRNSFVITPATLVNAKPNLILMHPLPRVSEISPDVDIDPRAAYFRQMENGMYVRMALLLLVLGKV